MELTAVLQNYDKFWKLNILLLSSIVIIYYELCISAAMLQGHHQ